MTDFGELRALLHGEADEARWLEVCAWFDGAECSREELVATHLPYALDVMRRWPELMCQPSHHWLQQIFAGEQHAKFQLVRSLRLRGQHPTPEALEQLAGCEQLARVRTLYLIGTPIGVEQAQLLGKSRLFERVERFECSAIPLNGATLSALLSEGMAQTLRLLDLSSSRLSAAAMRAIASHPWQQLDELILWNTRLTDDALFELTASPHLAALKTLNLGSNPYITSISRVLAASSHFSPSMRVVR